MILCVEYFDDLQELVRCRPNNFYDDIEKLFGEILLNQYDARFSLTKILPDAFLLMMDNEMRRDLEQVRAILHKFLFKSIY